MELFDSLGFHWSRSTVPGAVPIHSIERVAFRFYRMLPEFVWSPKLMGIGEIFLIKPRCVIANIQNNTIVDLIPNRNKETVVKYLSNMANHDKVQFVAMDMWTPYRDAVIAVMPQAKIVIDKFHVVKMANEAIEKARKGLRAELTIHRGAHKLENARPKSERRRKVDSCIRFSFPRSASVADFAETSEAENDELVESTKNYGADITTLVSLLEASSL